MGTIGLAQAQNAWKGHQFRCEIDAEGGTKTGVVSLEAGRKMSWADTLRSQLKLDGKDAPIGGRNLEIDGEQTRCWDDD
jgi:hypothetical protein